MKHRRLYLALRLLTCFLFMLAVAIQRDARIFGYELRESDSGESAASVPAICEVNGSLIILTEDIARDIKGYGGSIPLRITVTDAHIASIEVLPNSETPSFFRKVEQELIPGWIGLSVEEALNRQADAVTGATYSSQAVNETVLRAMQLAAETLGDNIQEERSATALPFKQIITLLVVLGACVLPFFLKSKRYRTIQLILNVVVLGLWSGTFLSYSLLVNYLSNGLNLRQAIVPVVILVVAFVYPFFGRTGHYCNWVCPLGAIQELAGKCVRRKVKLPQHILRGLNRFHDWLWAALMLLMWAGVWFDWMNYELFLAFLFRQASVCLIAAAIVVVLLSAFVHRPYCRFICPTGKLLSISQNPK